MHPGSEVKHLTELVQVADHRGSDVNLRTQEVLEGQRQAVPYPAFCWQWRVVQSYAWNCLQHINVLEYTAFLNYIRRVLSSAVTHGHRMLHVFDSRVVSCVSAKGRSSSRALNRVARRVAAYVLFADIYPLPLWTISAWNHADAASRLYDLIGRAAGLPNNP